MNMEKTTERYPIRYYSMITVAKDRKNRISAAGEMSYFSLLHLYGTNDRERSDVILNEGEGSAPVVRKAVRR